jgi:hypothetical protein
MDPDADHLLALACVDPTASPRIIQLSPIPGNIYDKDHFYYNAAAVVSQDDFGAVLAFALAHSHPVVVHKSPDIHKFQAAHPSANPLGKVPLAIIAWGLALLSAAQTLSPPAVDQPPPVVATAPLAGDQQFVIHTAPLTSVDTRTPSDGSCALLTSKSGNSLNQGGDPPPVGVVHPSSWASVGIQVPCIVVCPQQFYPMPSLTLSLLAALAANC